MPRKPSKKCTKCKKNEAKYRWRQHDRICRYCWDRYDNANLAKLSDEEIEAMYQKAISKQQKRDGIVNARMVGN